MGAIRFVLNGREQELRGVPPGTTLLRWLRDRAGLTGTKEGCAEGDCGACTVAMLDPGGIAGPAWRAVNACLLPLPAVHGRRVLTVEGLDAGGELHPAQAEIARHFGSQCGYCTPGVVLSLFEACYRQDLDSPARLDDQLCGNLCRCTGYRPIREVARGLAGTRPAGPFLEALSSPQPPPEPLDFGAGGQRFVAPVTLASALELLASEPEHRLVCGATDLGLELASGRAAPGLLVSLERVPELRRIRRIDGGWSVGAGVLIAELEAWSGRRVPALASMLRFFGSRQVKNRATLGGNLCTASPVGDTAPVLLALGARAVLRRAGGERRVPLEGFFTGYRRTALEPGELLAAVELPDLPPGARAAAFKVSKRRELDIAAVSAGMFVRTGDDGRVAELRLAYGGMAPTPARARATEAALLGGPWTEQAAERAGALLARDFQPISDHRASGRYRARVARALLRRFARPEPA